MNERDPFLEPVSLQVLDNLPAFVMLAGPEGKVQFFNRVWYAFTGQPPLSGDDDGSWSSYLHPDDGPEIVAAWQAVVERGAPQVEMRYRLRHAESGDYRWVTSTARPIYDEDGVLRHWLGVAREDESADRTPRTAGGAGGLRERKRMRLRDDIRRVALELFQLHGYDRVSIPEIADAVDVSAATVFRYFPAKAAIVLGIRNDPGAQRIAASASPLEDAPLAHGARLAGLAWAAEARTDRSHLAVERLIASTPALVLEAQLVREDATRELAESIVAACTGEDPLVEAAAIAAATTWPAFAAQRHWSTDAGQRALDEIVDEAYRALDAAFGGGRVEPLLTVDPTAWPAADADRSELGGLRGRKALQLRRRLQRAALRLLAQRGYTTTTVDDIVREAEVSRRTFFRYYDSKEDVLVEDVARLGDPLRDLVAAVPPEQPPLPAALAALRSLAAALAAVAESDPHSAALPLHAHPELRPARAKIRLHWTRRLTEGLQQRVGEDNDLAAAVVAATAVNAVADTIDRWSAERAGARLPERVDATLVALAHAIAAAR